MAGAQSHAEVVWQGDLIHGSGTLRVESGAIPELPVTWASRTQRSKGKTSPEELLAAAQASCYAMAFSNGLAKQGAPPTRLEVGATCSFEPVEGGYKITTMDLEVRGVVPGLDQQRFEALAREQGCPVSDALQGNVEIRVQARLLPQ